MTCYRYVLCNEIDTFWNFQVFTVVTALVFHYNLPVTCSFRKTTTVCQLHVHICNFAKWTVLLNIVAQIVTLCKDSLHADWTLIIAGIDANIEYTIVALSHRTGQLIYHRKDRRNWYQLNECIVVTTVNGTTCPTTLPDCLNLWSGARWRHRKRYTWTKQSASYMLISQNWRCNDNLSVTCWF